MVFMFRNLMRIATAGGQQSVARPQQRWGVWRAQNLVQQHWSRTRVFVANSSCGLSNVGLNPRYNSAAFASSMFGDLSRGSQADSGKQLRFRTKEHSHHGREIKLELLRLYASSADQNTSLSSADHSAAPQPESGEDGSHLTLDTNGQPGSFGHHGRQLQAPSGPTPIADSQHKQHRETHAHGVHAGESANGRPVPAWKLRLGQYLESNRFHMAVISLVMLDLTIVVTELILGSLFAHGQHMPHAVHVAEEILSWSSIGILCLFAAELVAKLTCFGTAYFAHSKWHMVDAVVITLSLGLELTPKGVAGEAASLLMFFRLWKYTPEFLRVARHAPEAVEVARVARHAPEVARMLGRTPEFLRAIRHSPEVMRVARHVPEAFRVFRHIPEFFRFARHTPELFRLWRVARIAHASAEVMALHNSMTLEEARHALAALQKELEGEQKRIKLMEAELVATKTYLTAEQQAEVAADMLNRFPPPSPASPQSSMDKVWEDGLHTQPSSTNGSLPNQKQQ